MSAAQPDALREALSLPAEAGFRAIVSWLDENRPDVLRQWLRGEPSAADQPKAQPDALLPCPFCGGEASQPWGSTAVCCETSSCAGFDMQASPKQWNRRALSAADQRAEAGQVYRIRHTDGRWRTWDSIGAWDWTDDEAKALGFSLREHADIAAADDPEDVRIVAAPPSAPAAQEPVADPTPEMIAAALDVLHTFGSPGRKATFLFGQDCIVMLWRAMNGARATPVAPIDERK